MMPTWRATARSAAVAAGWLLAAVPAAWAQFGYLPQMQAAPRGYLSVGAGWSAFSVDCGSTRQCERVDGAGRIAAGLFVTPYVAFEIAAADFGKSRIGTRSGDANLGVRMAGFGVAFPLDDGSRFNGLLRLGVANVQSTLQPLAPGLQASSSTSAEGYYGLTIGYMLATHLAAELSFDGTRSYSNVLDFRVDAVTLGLSLRF